MSDHIFQEKELLQRIAQGDEKAFRTIFDQYKDQFYAAALKMTRSTDVAEEIVQEVFVALWMQRSALAVVEYPSSYLFTIVYNNINKHFKKLALEKRIRQSVSERAPDSECITENELIEKENRQLLTHIIQQLPPQQQLVYELSKQEGLSRDEIADRLHISPNTVKNHLLKALKYIRLHFTEALFLLLYFLFNK